MLGDTVFHHPKDVQDGKVAVGEGDILTNLPYVAGCALCFDHHASEALRHSGKPTPGYILQPEAKSAARWVCDHYGGKTRFPRTSDAMMDAVDKADSAESAGFSGDDELAPQGWELLLFLMDARTGQGRFRDFRVSNCPLMMMLIDCCRDLSIAEILALPDVKERVDLFFAQHALFRAQIARIARIPGSPRCTTSGWRWTCAMRPPPTPATAVWSTPCFRSAISRCMLCGAARS